jgi:hypothetical protein
MTKYGQIVHRNQSQELGKLVTRRSLSVMMDTSLEEFTMTLTFGVSTRGSPNAVVLDSTKF